MKQAVVTFLRAIGEDPEREGLRDTPQRVAESVQELFSGYGQTAKEILERRFEINHKEMVLVKDIEVFSFCEHHLLPFYGVAHICYIPDGKQVTGLSKLARLVDCQARRLQIQEQLTSQIADALVDELNASGVMVVLECEHLCMSMRGIKKPGSRTVTSAVRGSIASSAKTRSEVLGLINR